PCRSRSPPCRWPGSIRPASRRHRGRGGGSRGSTCRSSCSAGSSASALSRRSSSARTRRRSSGRASRKPWNSVLLGRKDHGATAGQYAAGAVADRVLHVVDLTVAADAPELAGGLDHREDAVHARVAIGEATAVRVERELAARGGPLPLDEVLAFAAAAKAERLEGQKDSYREGVIDHGEIHVLRRPAGHSVCRGTAALGDLEPRHVGHVVDE